MFDLRLNFGRLPVDLVGLNLVPVDCGMIDGAHEASRISDTNVLAAENMIGIPDPAATVRGRVQVFLESSSAIFSPEGCIA